MTPTRVTLAVLCGALLLSQPAVAQATATTTTATRAAPDKAALRALAQRDVAAGATGVVVLVNNGKYVIRLAVGRVRLQPQQTLAWRDEMRIGSNTKTFVATVMLQLVAEKRLGLDDPVRRWLPGVIPDDGRITVRMLLNHTSGLFNYTEDASFSEEFYRSPDRVDRVFTPRELVAYATAHKPLFAAGGGWSYSNTNYIVAGLILERVTGQPVAALIRQRIVRPLGLRHTYLQSSAAFRGRYAHGYLTPEDSGSGYVDTSTRNDASATWAAGAMVSTASELDRFHRALMSGRLLPPAQLREMMTVAPQSLGRTSLGRGSAYGLGLISVSMPAGRIWGHDGSIPGYLTFAFVDQRGDRSAQVLVPTEPTAAISEATNAVLVAAVSAMLA